MVRAEGERWWGNSGESRGREDRGGGRMVRAGGKDDDGGWW